MLFMNNTTRYVAWLRWRAGFENRRSARYLSVQYVLPKPNNAIK